MKFEFLEHTADIKIRAYGKTLEEAFENIVLAFSDFVAKGEKIKPRKAKVVNLSGKDKENILYNLIDELIYFLDVENFLVSKAEIIFRGNNIRAELFGDDSKKYTGLDYIKAATYSEMKINQNSEGTWIIEAVVDV